MQPAQEAAADSPARGWFLKSYQHQAEQQKKRSGPLRWGERFVQPEVGKDDGDQDLTQAKQGSLHAAQMLDTEEQGEAGEKGD